LLGNRTSVRLGVRPWGIHVNPATLEGSVPATVAVVENLGDETRVGVRYGDILLMASTDMTRAYKPGSKVNLIFEDEDLNLFDQDTGERLTP
ncbi:MAG: TOBE domain-containing protein, partial [Terrimicrobiaceae bacterium]